MLIAKSPEIIQSVQTQNMVSLNGSIGQISVSAGSNIGISNNNSTIIIFASAGGGGGDAIRAISGSNTSYSNSTLTFGNLNGFTFYGSNGSIVGSYTVPTLTNQAISGSNNSLAASTFTFGNSNGISFYFTNNSMVASHNALITAMQSDAGSNWIYASAGKNLTNISATLSSNNISLSVGNYITTAMLSQNTSLFQYTTATSAITVNAVNTSERASLQYTSANSSFQYVSQTSLSLGTGAAASFFFTSASSLLQHTTATSAITASAVNTSVTSNYQLMANSSLSLGTAATQSFRYTSADSQLQFTSANSLFQYTSQNSLSLGTAATQSFVFTSQSSLFQHTSATSAITVSAMNTNERGNYIYSSASKNLTNISVTLGSSAISLSVGNYLTTAMVSGANTSFVNASAAFQGYNATGTIASNGISVSVAPPGAAAENNWVNISGNVAGNTTASGSTINWVAGNNITLSGLNNSQMRIDAAAGGGGATDRQFCEIIQGERLTTAIAQTASQLSNRIEFSPFWINVGSLSANTVEFLISGAASSNTVSLVASFNVGLYSMKNTSQLTLVTSTVNGFSFTDSSRWNSQGIWMVTGLGGTNLTEGRWIMGLLIYATATAHMNLRVYGGDALPNFVKWVDGAAGGGTTATNNNSLVVPFWGVYSATTSGLPNSVNLTQVYGGRSAELVDYYAVIREIGQA